MLSAKAAWLPSLSGRQTGHARCLACPTTAWQASPTFKVLAPLATTSAFPDGERRWCGGTRARWLPAGRFESAAEDRRKRRFVSVGSQKGSMSTLHVGRQRRQPHSKLRRCIHIDAGPRDEKGRGRGAGAFLALVRSGCGTGARYLAGLTATAKAADFKPAGWMIISLRMWRAQRELWRNRRRLTSSVMLCAAKCLCR